MEQIKMKLMSDVDGVLVNFNETFAKWVAAKNPEVKLDHSDWYFGLPRQLAYDSVMGFWQSGEIRHLPFYPDAQENLNSLRDLFEIHIVTALNPEFREFREENLKGVKYDSLSVVGSAKKHHVINILQPDVAFEDKPELIEAFSEAGIDVFYPDIPLTKDMKKYGTPYRSWNELVTLVRFKYDQL